MKELKIYLCEHCGAMAEVLEGNVTPTCCGNDMKLLKANTVDAAKEKHVPVISREDDALKVTVGSVLHPMTDEHYIKYIWVVFDNKVGRDQLDPTDKPEAIFHPGVGKADVYEYCTLHGLWKTEA